MVPSSRNISNGKLVRLGFRYVGFRLYSIWTSRCLNRNKRNGRRKEGRTKSSDKYCFPANTATLYLQTPPKKVEVSSTIMIYSIKRLTNSATLPNFTDEDLSFLTREDGKSYFRNLLKKDPNSSSFTYKTPPLDTLKNLLKNDQVMVGLRDILTNLLTDRQPILQMDPKRVSCSSYPILCLTTSAILPTRRHAHTR